MPLDPSTSETSCLSYIGGSHLGDSRPHHFHDDHMIAEDVDASHAVACPRSAGEAIAHHCLTLHSAGPNASDRPRRAFVIVCRIAS
jgi:ectoine hydroxylase-related dioxygenase (phytanoyl-CoA dioxygenase family)